MSWGKLYGVGVGPGAPDLLTLRARAVLERVPVLWEDGEPVQVPLLGGTTGEAQEIDDTGAIVGSAALDDEVKIAAIWIDGEPVPVGELREGDYGSIAYAMNPDGLMVGFITNEFGLAEPVLWTPKG